MSTHVDVVIVGAGVFGLTAALELRRRGREVAILDGGPIPHPLAASTDRSKIVRLDYGADETYTAWMEDALAGWRRWPPALFRETGVLFLSPRELSADSFEGASFDVVRRRGHVVERLSSTAIRHRFPAWNADKYVDGYHHRQGGWVNSGDVVSWLASEARDAGVVVHESHRASDLSERRGRIVGVVLDDGREIGAGEAVVLATGAWTPHLRSETSSFLRSPGQPVFLLRPTNAELFASDRFPVWAADIARTGWYGFPIGDDGIVKVARHGRGRFMHPESPERRVSPAEETDLRAFLRESIPALADAPLAGSRLCLYSDSPDGHPWIARDPTRPGLVVATGGSGHAFKFAPLLGTWIADAVEGLDSEALQRFRWRPEVSWHNREEARCSE